ncbi:MAG: response regulator [Oligoflexia bacterium]|nr:response regulator [Oligoflexia bacterium]
MSKKILIVESDFDFAELTAEVLKDNRYEITVILDGTKAIEYLSLTTPDLIVMEIILPSNNGFAVAAYLNTRLNKDVPILFTSTSANIAKILKDKNAKNRYFLEKPFEYDNFVSVIKYFFENNTFENYKKGA